MRTPATTPPNVDALEEAEFRTRMARVTSTGPIRPAQRAAQEEVEEKDGGFRFGWAGWLAIDVLIIAGTVATVIAWPPIQSCRDQEKSVGFYAGDTVGKCIRRGVGERITAADQHIKMMIRGSGH